MNTVNKESVCVWIGGGGGGGGEIAGGRPRVHGLERGWEMISRETGREHTPWRTYIGEVKKKKETQSL